MSRLFTYLASLPHLESPLTFPTCPNIHPPENHRCRGMWPTSLTGVERPGEFRSKKKKEFNTDIVRGYKMNCLPRNTSCRVR